jgi:hypothetical protein
MALRDIHRTYSDDLRVDEDRDETFRWQLSLVGRTVVAQKTRFEGSLRDEWWELDEEEDAGEDDGQEEEPSPRARSSGVSSREPAGAGARVAPRRRHGKRTGTGDLANGGAGWPA